MSPSTIFGFTITLNKKKGMKKVKDKIESTLNELKTNKDIMKVYNSSEVGEGMENTYISIHKKPETDEYFKVYHFIANAYRPERQSIAKEARK
jgi:hypothetical protein